MSFWSALHCLVIGGNRLTIRFLALWIAISELWNVGLSELAIASNQEQGLRIAPWLREFAPACKRRGVMPNKKTVFGACDATQVAMLERSLAIICPRQIDFGSDRETELRSELARCIQNFAAKGYTNSDELTKRCVEELLLGPRLP